MERGYLAGAIDYLYSPVDSDVLRRKAKALGAFSMKNLECKLKAEALEQTIRTLQERIRVLEGAAQNRLGPVDSGTSPRHPDPRS